MTQSLPNLVSVGVIEKDTNNDIMLTWSYPSISSELEPILIARSRLDSPTLAQFVFSKYESHWMYFYATVLHHTSHDRGLSLDFEADAPSDQSEPRHPLLPRLNVFTIAIIAKEFNPELYAAMASVFAMQYRNAGTPLPILSGFLSVLTSQSITFNNQSDNQSDNQTDNESVSFAVADYDRRAALLATPLKDVIRMFGIESILIWTALMMKKRIVVYSEGVGMLLKVIRSFPLFVSHRQDWEILRPFVNVTDNELEDLRKAGVYCAGFIDDSIQSRTNLYDLYVDINTRTISVPEHAKVDFRLGAFHKELATWMIASAEDPEIQNQQIIRELAVRTREFLNKLTLLQVEDEDGNQYISYENLQERKLPPNMDHFLYAVAAAEGMTKGTSR